MRSRRGYAPKAVTSVNDSRKFPWLGGLVAALLVAAVLIAVVVQGTLQVINDFAHPGRRHQLPALTRAASQAAGRLSSQSASCWGVRGKKVSNTAISGLFTSLSRAARSANTASA